MPVLTVRCCVVLYSTVCTLPVQYGVVYVALRHLPLGTPVPAAAAGVLRRHQRLDMTSTDYVTVPRYRCRVVFALHYASSVYSYGHKSVRTSVTSWSSVKTSWFWRLGFLRPFVHCVLRNSDICKIKVLYEQTRELPGERDNARNNARFTKARKATHGLDGQHQDVDRTLRGRVNQNDRGQG